MPKRQVFFSFHYSQDVMRVAQIRNIGALEDNKPVNDNDWESISKAGDAEIKAWIDRNLAMRSCLIVLIGEKTASRKYVQYEIEKAWISNKAVFGIYIHNLKHPTTGKSQKGSNPFDGKTFKLSNGNSVEIAAYNPNPDNAYQDIARNIESWTEIALRQVGKN